MKFPGEADLRAERAAIIETFDSLTEDEFESATTLCELWAPRDVLAHLIGVDTALVEYVRHAGRFDRANAAIVAKARPMSRDRLMNKAHHWASKPAPLTRLAAYQLLGDTAIHHQDILRPLGVKGEILAASAAAILREGVMMGVKKLLSNHVESTDGSFSFGRGPVVRGTNEALGMWLAGRKGLEPDLEFVV